MNSSLKSVLANTADFRQRLFGQVAVTHAPLINPARQTTGTRLHVTPLPGRDVEVADVWETYRNAWGESTLALSLCIDVPVDLSFIERAQPHPAMTLEIPSSQVVDSRSMALVLRLHQAGFNLAMLGRPLIPVPPQLLKCFRYSVMALSEDRRHSRPAPQGVERTVPFYLSGIETVEQLEDCFSRGAAASIGWPIDDLPSSVGKTVQTNLQSVTEAMRQVDLNADPAKIEAAMRSDPTLTYRLLRHINSAGFGLLSEVRSIRDAVVMLGYGPLKRWLLVLLATSVKDSNRIPVAYASVRRGFFLEALIDRRSDPGLADDLFVLGLFSLMDRMLGKSRAELFEEILLADSVADALLHNTGPYVDYLHLMEWLETSVPDAQQFQDLLDAHVLSPSRCNEALTYALLEAHVLETSAR